MVPSRKGPHACSIWVRLAGLVWLVFGLALAWYGMLGHRFEHLISQGAAKDYVAIAAATGVSRTRVTQIANLTFLSPAIQERIILDDIDGLSERILRSVLVHSSWSVQERIFECLVSKQHHRASPSSMRDLPVQIRH